MECDVESGQFLPDEISYGAVDDEEQQLFSLLRLPEDTSDGDFLDGQEVLPSDDGMTYQEEPIGDDDGGDHESKGDDPLLASVA